MIIIGYRCNLHCLESRVSRMSFLQHTTHLLQEYRYQQMCFQKRNNCFCSWSSFHYVVNSIYPDAQYDIDISLVWTLKLLTFHSKQFGNMTLEPCRGKTCLKIFVVVKPKQWFARQSSDTVRRARAHWGPHRKSPTIVLCYIYPRTSISIRSVTNFTHRMKVSASPNWVKDLKARFPKTRLNLVNRLNWKSCHVLGRENTLVRK